MAKELKPHEFQIGNQLWKNCTTFGRGHVYENAEDLWKGCTEYFEWIEANPLVEAKLTSYQGENELEPIPKMHAMTIGGLCLFLDIARSTWKSYVERSDAFSAIITRAEEIIYEQKFTGASADLLNANIIARDLGLAEKQEITAKATVSDKPLSVDEWEKEFGDGDG